MDPFLKAKSELKLLASKFDKKINKALLDAFSKMKGIYSEAQLVGVIEKNGIAGMLSLVNQLDISGHISSAISENLVQAVSESGRIILSNMPAGTLLQNYTFSILDPKTIESIKNHNAKLVQSISNKTRDGIVNNVRRNVIAGTNPRRAARDFRETIGLTDKQSTAVDNFRTALESSDRIALSRSLRDKRFDSTIKSILDGKKVPQEKIDTMVSRYREKYIKYRAETISRTESMRGLSMGEHLSLQQANDQGKLNPNVRRFWIATSDNRTRNWHRDIPSLNSKGVAVNQSFNTRLGPLQYPRDPGGLAANTINCRCRVRYEILTGDEAVPIHVPEVKPKITVKKPKVKVKSTPKVTVPKTTKPKKITKPGTAPKSTVGGTIPSPSGPVPSTAESMSVSTPNLQTTSPSLLDSVPKKFVDTAEAEKWISDRITDVSFSFEGIDSRLLPDIVDELRILGQDFPTVMRNTKYIGTDMMSRTSMEKLNTILPQSGDYRLVEFAKNLKKEFTGLRKETYATCWRNEGWESILLNKNVLSDAKVFAQLLKNDVNSGFLVKGSGSIRSMIAHEFGHNIDNYIKNKLNKSFIVGGSDQSIAVLRNELIKGTMDILGGDASLISQYAATNDCELLAECFAAYRNSSITSGIEKQAVDNIGKFLNDVQTLIREQRITQFANKVDDEFAIFLDRWNQAKKMSPDDYFGWARGDTQTITKFIDVQDITNVDFKFSIEDYQGAGYMPINEYLRAGIVDESTYYTKNQLKNLVTNISQSFTEEGSVVLDDTIVYRGVSDYKKVFGDVDLNNLVGRSFEDKGFVSTSTNPGMVKTSFADRSGAFMEILLPKNTKCIIPSNVTSDMYNECEILLNKNAKFKIMSVDKTPNGIPLVRMMYLGG